VRAFAIACAAAVGAAAAIAPAGAGDAQVPSVALVARPTVLGPAQLTTLRGTISNQREREQVELRVKDCGQLSTRSLGLAYTGPGGTFEQDFSPGVNATVTAHWNGAVSAPIQLRQEPYLRLRGRRAGRFQIGVGSRGWMWHKKVTIQRRVGGRWTAVKKVALTDSANTSGQGGYSWTGAEFRLRVARGSTIRALLPRSQAKPCYLASVSNNIRT
jgi:lipoprotein-anchoring transpeptidase ErfK/SrfK